MLYNLLWIVLYLLIGLAVSLVYDKVFRDFFETINFKVDSTAHKMVLIFITLVWPAFLLIDFAMYIRAKFINN